jgi:hypothetical protein
LVACQALRVEEFGFWAGDGIMLLHQLSPDSGVLKVEIFRVYGLGFRVKGLGFEVWSDLLLPDLAQIQGLGFRVCADLLLLYLAQIQGLGFRV